MVMAATVDLPRQASTSSAQTRLLRRNIKSGGESYDSIIIGHYIGVSSRSLIRLAENWGHTDVRKCAALSQQWVHLHLSYTGDQTKCHVWIEG